MDTATYATRRSELTTYFDKTAADAWARLTSDAKVSGIRATVRAGRERMRATILSWLPEDLSGDKLLDAGCGTGALSVEAAKRGAHVTAVDVAPTLVGLAEERLPHEIGGGAIDFFVGDMLDPAFGAFEHVVAMDSLIHYEKADVVAAVARLARRTHRSIVFTFAPATPMLSSMHAVGKFFPRSDRAPAIVPIAPGALARALRAEPALSNWRIGRTLRVKSGFYTSEAMELVRS